VAELSPVVVGSQLAGSDWLRSAQCARRLAAGSLVWLCFEGAATTTAGLLAGSTALLANGLDGAIEGLASIIVLWRFSGSRTPSPSSERKAQRFVALSFFLLALAGLLADTLLGIWWLDPVVALGIAALAIIEGRCAWRGESCGCAAGCGQEVVQPE
jgi:divalent metal cation (Fe/Co/Zn/Cd) transporter